MTEIIFKAKIAKQGEKLLITIPSKLRPMVRHGEWYEVVLKPIREERVERAAKKEPLTPEALLATLHDVYTSVEKFFTDDFKVFGRVPMKKPIPSVGKSLLDLLKEELNKRGYEVPSDLKLFSMLWDLYTGQYADVRRELMRRYPRVEFYTFEPGLSWKHEWFVSL